MTQEQKIIRAIVVIDEFYRVAFRKSIYRAIEELQADLYACAGALSNGHPYSNRVQ